jgi:hypothetical protein
VSTRTRSTSERIIDGILQVAAPMFAAGALDRKALRVRLRALAAETGTQPVADSRQIKMFTDDITDGH